MILDELITRVKETINHFVLEQGDLLKQDPHEEAISGKLLGYLERHFADLELHIDTQYNRRILDNELVLKQSEFLIHVLPIKHWPKNWENDQTHIKKEILPDIIIHDRQSRNRNFLIIEIKKSSNKVAADRAWDDLKLKEMTQRDLNYAFGLFLDLKTGDEFNPDNPYTITVYVGGQIVYSE